MHRIDTATAENGKFVNGNSNQGIKGTQVDNTWLNSVQEELANIVESAGKNLSKSNDAQVLPSIKVIVAGMFEPLNSSDSLTPSISRVSVGNSVTIKTGDVVDITITADVQAASTSEDYLLFYREDSESDHITFDTTIKGMHTQRLAYTATSDYTGKIGNVTFRHGLTQDVILLINGVIIHNA